ncbi:MAG: AAA family ATPase [Candidatus Coatesbacteria bacterium]|nr:AAA family ATPase [Candidatus Coatesbacteria bacterium]
MKNLLAFLNPDQLQAVTHRGSPLLVLAGAGTGKTRVVTVRIAHLLDRGECQPQEILAITFTNKAAGEMRERVNGLLGGEEVRGTAARIWIHTFHAFCARLLRREIHHLPEREREFVIATKADQTAILKRLIGPDRANEEPKASRVLSVISRAKNNLITPGSFPAHTSEEKRIKELFAAYEQELRETGALDYADLILLTVTLFHEYPDILDRYRGRFRHLLVDEYQDTNTAQHDLVRMLAGDGRNLCLVGDPDQSIYRWRGAEPENMLRFSEEFPDTRVVKLLENYRSTGNILKVANTLIAANPRPMGEDKDLWTKGESGAKLTVYAGPDEYDESGWIATQIFNSVHNRRENKYEDFAILYRTNAQSRILEDALRKRSIPYNIIADVRFYDRREIRDLLAYLRLLINPNDLLSFRRIVNVPSRGVGKISVNRILDEVDKDPGHLPDVVRRCIDQELIPPRARRAVERLMDLFDELTTRGGGVDGLLEELLERIDYTSWLQKSNDAVSRLENVEKFTDTARDFATANPKGSLEDFLEEVSLAAPIDDFDEQAGSVSLLTLHAAKGLEFPVVFISGLEEGLIPLTGRRGKRQADIEEERRLLYVGITRAQYKVYLTRALRRNLEGRKVYNKPSRFLSELPDPLLEDLSMRNLSIMSTTEDLIAVETETKKIKQTAKSVSFQLGDRVWHDKWGRGIILSRAGDGPNLKLTVKFARHGIKKLVAKYANLQKM